MKKIISIIGARPQFIKHAPMQLELQKRFNALTIHTGQHYDANMSDIFFTQLNMAKPDYLFDIGGSRPQGEQTGIMMTEIEKVCQSEKPDAMLLYGDTNSTLAGALVAAKMQIPQIHVEAGLRSYNRTMPEEVNRIIADEFAYLLFCPTASAIANLNQEGINHDRIFLSGDVMCDTLKLVEGKAKRLFDAPYYFATLHRPYNTDDENRLAKILEIFDSLEHQVVFPLHPRTLSRMQTMGLSPAGYKNILFVDPVGYLDCVSYQTFAEGIITDSGGMQKEAYILKKKCITMRSETEWIETLDNGWNTLLFDELDDLKSALALRPGNYKPGLYGEGNAAEQITDIILRYI
jgi:UDP-GlcNAc3NAcA epimerase